MNLIQLAKVYRFDFENIHLKYENNKNYILVKLNKALWF